MKHYVFKTMAIVFVFFVHSIGFGQSNVGIGTGSPNSSAILDIVATNKGVAFPTLTNAQRATIVTPKEG